MKYFYNFLIGILIGFGAILPGVSSGVFCVIFGIYEKLVDSIVNFFKDMKNNFLFIFPIGLGSIVGVILLGNVIKYFFSLYQFQSCYVFIGLILGTIPALFKQASSDKYIDTKKLIPMIISFLIGIGLIILEKKSGFTTAPSLNVTSPFYLLFAGFIMAVGIVVPGISNTVILMCLGVYSTYINAVSTIDFRILIPMGIGLLFGGLLWIRIIKYLFDKHHQTTSLCIIGFTLGSIFVLFPGFAHGVSGLICYLLFFVSLILSYKLAKLESKVNIQM